MVQTIMRVVTTIGTTTKGNMRLEVGKRYRHRFEKGMGYSYFYVVSESYCGDAFLFPTGYVKFVYLNHTANEWYDYQHTAARGEASKDIEEVTDLMWLILFGKMDNATPNIVSDNQSS